MSLIGTIPPIGTTPLVGTIPPPPSHGIQLGPLDLRFYGLLIAIGAYVAIVLTTRRYERLGGDPRIAEQAGLVALAAGVIGARIGYVLPRLDVFAEEPLRVFAIWQGGLALFGGLIGGAIGVIAYVRLRGGDVPAIADAIAPALPLAQAIGRWGNYFNQELYGRPTDLPWALEVEPAFRRPGVADQATFHPTFLYESLWNAVLVLVLLRIDRTGRLRRGSLFFVYLIGYGLGRAWIEALRIDTVERYLGLSRNNWIAIAIVLTGVAGLLWWRGRPVPSAVATGDAEGDAEDDRQRERASTVGDATAEAGEDVDGDPEPEVPAQMVGDTEPAVVEPAGADTAVTVEPDIAAGLDAEPTAQAEHDAEDD